MKMNSGVPSLIISQNVTKNPATVSQIMSKPVEIDKLSRFEVKSDVKVLAIGPSKQEVIVGGHNVLKLLKIEPDLSIKNVVRNFGVNK